MSEQATIIEPSQSEFLKEFKKKFQKSKFAHYTKDSNDNYNYLMNLVEEFYSDKQFDQQKLLQYLSQIDQKLQNKKKILQFIKDCQNQFDSKSNKNYNNETKGDAKKDKKEQNIGEQPKKKVKVDSKTVDKNIDKPNDKSNKADTQVKEQEGVTIGAKKGLKQELQNEGRQKCRFYPFCKNEDKCDFFHPTQKVQSFLVHPLSKKNKARKYQSKQMKKKKKKLFIKIDIFIKSAKFQKNKLLNGCNIFIKLLTILCTYFPNCRYGQSCLYAHDVCKFKEKCTKYTCPYAHPFKKPQNPFQQMVKGMLHNNNPLLKQKKKNISRKTKEQET